MCIVKLLCFTLFHSISLNTTAICILPRSPKPRGWCLRPSCYRWVTKKPSLEMKFLWHSCEKFMAWEPLRSPDPTALHKPETAVGGGALLGLLGANPPSCFTSLSPGDNQLQTHLCLCKYEFFQQINFNYLLHWCSKQVFDVLGSKVTS